jgi:hypothetical protein
VKIKISVKTLRKILVGTTIINYLLLGTFIFLLLSATTVNNYTVFLLSVPAYVLSRSWLLLVGLFGFEGLLLVYYWMKIKQGVPVEEKETDTQLTLGDNAAFDNLATLLSHDYDESTAVEPSSVHDEDRLSENEIEQQIRQFSERVISAAGQEQETPTAEEDPFEDLEADFEFDRLWEEAIDHVKLAGKKKASGEQRVNKRDDRETSVEQPAKRAANQPTQKKSAKHKTTDRSSSQRTQERPSGKPSINRPLKDQSNRAYSTNPPGTAATSQKNPSIIKEEHKQLYNEIAMNNWIYERKADRERVGQYKIALDETRFREKNLEYLFEGNILFKLDVPFPSGAFNIFTLFAEEDKKIIRTYLARQCSKQKLALKQKTIAFQNYQDFSLRQQRWRFDLYIPDVLLGLILTSNFLLLDSGTNKTALTLAAREQIKALLAACQLQFDTKELTAMIITDTVAHAALLEKHLHRQGFGQAAVLAFGHQQFPQQFEQFLHKTMLSTN